MKTAVVTGGTHGIGRACVQKFANLGYRVFYCYSSEDVPFEQNTENIFGFRADVSSEQDVKKFVEYINGHSDTIDILVANAGVSHFGLFTEDTVSDWDRIFNINAKGVFLISKYVARKMISEKSGSIVTVSSIWGQVGASCESIYSASKSAVIGFTKSIAKELAPSGITANCVCPGVIDTRMNGKFTDDEIKDIIGEIPLERMGTPEEVAECIYSIATQHYITGQIISVNGGMF